MPSYKLKDCDVCGSSLVHHTICNRCGGGQEENMVIQGRRWLCAICDNSNPIQFVCDKCGSRFIYEEVVLSEEKGPVCPICKSELEKSESVCSKCESRMKSPEDAEAPVARSDISRLRRRKKGEYDEDDVKEISRIPGVGRERASSLCRAGYNSLWKIKRATEEDLCTIPGIGNETARRIKISTNLILVLSSKKSKEDVMSEERSCPKCDLPTSVFAVRCLDCGCEFDPEELDEKLRTELLGQDIKAMVEFYGHVVSKKIDDPKLWYALAIALSKTRRFGAARKALQKAQKIEPDNPRLSKLENIIASAEKETSEPRKRKTQKKTVDIVETKTPQEDEEARFSQDAIVETRTPQDAILERLRFELIDKPGKPADVQCPRCNEFAPFGKESCPFCGFLLRKSADLPEPPEEIKTEPIQEMAVEPEPQAPAPEPSPPLPEPSQEAPSEPLEEPPPPVSQEPLPSQPEPEEKSQEKPRIEIVSKPRQSDSLRSAITPGRRPLLTSRGLVNGKGRVNGLINGNGFINGGMLSDVWLPRSNIVQRYVAIAIALITTFLIVNTVITFQYETQSAMQIDGNFSDWQGIMTYHDAYPSSNSDVNLTSYSLNLIAPSLFLMAEVEGMIFADSQGYDSLYIFMDTDADATTGYMCGALGADYLVTIEGTDGAVSSASLSMFLGQDRLDWNRWTSVGGVAAISSGSKVEAVADTSMVLGLDVDILLMRFVMDDQEGNTSESSIAVGPSRGALKVTQRGLRETVQTGATDFLQLTFELIGSPLTLAVDDLEISHSAGTEVLGIPTRFTIIEGTQTIIIARVDATVVPTGDVIEVSLDHVRADRPVTIIGNGARAYSMSAPTEKRIDGLFADWPSPVTDTDPIQLEDSSIDIVAHDANVTSGTTFVYFRTSDQTFEGSLTPVHKVKSMAPPGTGGSPGPTMRLSGESVARAYIDSDPSDQTGFSIQGIRAKYMIEAEGQLGTIFSINGYRWEGRWVLFSGNPRISNGFCDVEMSMSFAGAISENYTYVIETRNWRGLSDMTFTASTRDQEREGTRGLEFEIRGSSTLMLALPTSSPPTIDGDWSASEWQDADRYDTGNLTIYTMQDGTNVYICIRVTDDTTYNAGDFVRIAFDTDNGDETGPDQWDKMFGARDPDGSAMIEDFNGDGTTWDPSYVSPYFWTANGLRDMSDGNVITFEFLIPFPEVWNTTTPSSGQRAGMAIHAHDDRGTGYDYYWGSNDLDDPSSYGHLDIPEFEDVVFVLIMMPIVFILIRRSGKVNKQKGH